MTGVLRAMRFSPYRSICVNQPSRVPIRATCDASIAGTATYISDMTNAKRSAWHSNEADCSLDYLASLWRTYPARSAVPRTYLSFYGGFYGGEPLMNTDFITRMVDYAGKLDVRRNFIFSMTTDAMLLDRYTDYLVEKRFHLLIRLDGDKHGQSRRATHDGKNSFDRVCKNAKDLQAKYPDYFTRYVEFDAVLHNRNGVARTHDFIMREFGKKPTVSESNNSGIRPDKVEEFGQYMSADTSSRYALWNSQYIADHKVFRNRRAARNPAFGFALTRFGFVRSFAFGSFTRRILLSVRSIVRTWNRLAISQAAQDAITAAENCATEDFIQRMISELRNPSGRRTGGS